MNKIGQNLLFNPWRPLLYIHAHIRDFNTTVAANKTLCRHVVTANYFKWDSSLKWFYYIFSALIYYFRNKTHP